MEALLEHPYVPDDLVLDIRRTQARIAFDERRYEDALAAFSELRETAADDPQLLLEMAWSHYYLGQSRRALGLLIALDAPAYRELIAPERFLLEALALRRICQFEPARRAAVRLRDRHGDAIAELYAGIPIKNSKALRAAAGLRIGGIEVAAFRDRIMWEQDRLDELSDSLGPKLSETLSALYEQNVTEALRREDEMIDAEAAVVANELLAADEGVRIILHELGVALLRGRRRPEGIEERSTLGELDRPEAVLYRFEGEFWTDELDDLVVTIEDRCID